MFDIVLSRDGSEAVRIPMDAAKFQRIKDAFEKNGGIIESSDEYDKYLDWRDADAATLDAKTMVFRQGSPPTASELFEELVHTAQHRKALVSTENVYELELVAKEKLIKYQKQYDIPDDEHLESVAQAESLKKYLFSKGR